MRRELVPAVRGLGPSALQPAGDGAADHPPAGAGGDEEQQVSSAGRPLVAAGGTAAQPVSVWACPHQPVLCVWACPQVRGQ